MRVGPDRAGAPRRLSGYTALQAIRNLAQLVEQ